MRKYLVFYPVENELNYERHSFDLMSDEEAWKELQKLESARVYDMTRSDRNGQMLDLGDFVEDYNDEELDGGWWSIILTLPEEQEEQRGLIGYQIMDDDCEFPEELFSFMVFKKEDDAYAYIQAKGLQGFNVIEQYEGDVEDPTFIGIRIFKEGERVFNCESNPHESDLRDWATVCQDVVEIYADQVVLVKMDDGSENETESGNLYQIAEGKVCPRCGNPLCIEHNDEIDYPYFCPDCDENFYGIEVQ